MKCKFCGKPFDKKVLLGPRKFPVWMHNYPTLNHCKALRFKQDFVNQLRKMREGVDRFLRDYGESEERRIRKFSEEAGA